MSTTHLSARINRRHKELLHLRIKLDRASNSQSQHILKRMVRVKTAKVAAEGELRALEAEREERAAQGLTPIPSPPPRSPTPPSEDRDSDSDDTSLRKCQARMEILKRRKAKKEEEKRRQEEEERRRLEEERRRKEEEERRQKEEEERRQKEEEDRIRREEEEKKRMEEEEKKRQEDAEKKRKLDLEKKRRETIERRKKEKEAEARRASLAQEVEPVQSLADAPTTSVRDVVPSPPPSPGTIEVEAYSLDFFTEAALDRYDYLDDSSSHEEYCYVEDHLDRLGITAFLKDMQLYRAVVYPQSYSERVQRIFYANVSKDFSNVRSDFYGKIILRNNVYDFSPSTINTFLGRSGISPAWDSPNDKHRDAKMIGWVLTGGKVVTHQPPIGSLTTFFAILTRICRSNWVPTSNAQFLHNQSMHLLYRLSRGIQVDLRAMIFTKIAGYANLDDKTINKSRLPFPFLIAGMLACQGFKFEAEDRPMVTPNVLRFTTKYTGPSRVNDVPWTRLGDMAEDRRRFRKRNKSIASFASTSKNVPHVDTPAADFDPNYLTSPGRLQADLSNAIETHELTGRHLKAILSRVTQASQRGGATLGLDEPMFKTSDEYTRAIKNLELMLKVFKDNEAAFLESLGKKEGVAEEEVAEDDVVMGDNVADEGEHVADAGVDSDEDIEPRAQKKRKQREEDVPVEVETVDEPSELSEAAALKATLKRSRLEVVGQDDLVKDDAGNVLTVSEAQKKEKAKGAGTSEAVQTVKPLKMVLPVDWNDNLPPMVNLVSDADEGRSSTEKTAVPGVAKTNEKSVLTPVAGTKSSVSGSQTLASPVKMKLSKTAPKLSLPAKDVASSAAKAVSKPHMPPPPPKGSRKKQMANRTLSKPKPQKKKQSKSKSRLRDEDDEDLDIAETMLDPDSDGADSEHESE